MLKCKNEAAKVLKTKEDAWVRLPKRTPNEPILRPNEPKIRLQGTNYIGRVRGEWESFRVSILAFRISDSNSELRFSSFDWVEWRVRRRAGVSEPDNCTRRLSVRSYSEIFK